MTQTYKNTMSRNKTLIVVNKLSGTVRTLGVDQVRTTLEDGFKGSHPPVEIHVRGGKEFDQLIDKSVKDPEMARIIVGGGDGTLSSVAAKLIGTDIALGILPLGTMNLFALGNGISSDFATAVKQLSTAEPAKIDVGVVNGKSFLRQISLGLQPHVVKERETIGYRSKFTKKWSGLKALIIVLSRLKNWHFNLHSDGKKLELISPALYISNNKYAPGLFPRQGEMNKGVIAVYAFRSTRLIELLKMSPYILRGQWWESPNVDTLSTHELVLHSIINRKIHRRRKKVLASLDGELHMLTLPLTIRSHPAVLNVLQGSKKETSS